LSDPGPEVWKSRITHYTMEAPDQLLANPKNFRRHPAHQKKILAGVAGTVGIVAPVIQNDRTGYMLDGHLRAEEAMERGVKELPVAHIDVSEEEETVLLATFDALGAMAFEDAAMKAALLKEASSTDDDLAEYFARELERQQAEAGFQEGVDALSTRYGVHDPTAFWPVIRLRVPDEVRARFISYFQSLPGPADHDRVTQLLDRLHAPHVDPDLVSEVSSD